MGKPNKSPVTHALMGLKHLHREISVSERIPGN